MITGSVPNLVMVTPLDEETADATGSQARSRGSTTPERTMRHRSLTPQGGALDRGQWL